VFAALGDPALLANELVQVEKRYNLGLVPHWSDRELETRFSEYNPRIIRVTDDPLWVLKEIGQCRKIVSSSLHGIIVADAFGIPRRIETCPTVLREGGDFKFRDHNAAVGVQHSIGLTQEAPRFRIQDCQHAVWDMLNEVGRRINRENR
jgi:pyruvyltransferase